MCLGNHLPVNTFESSPHLHDYSRDLCNYSGIDSSGLDPTDHVFRVIQLNIRGFVNKQEKLSRLLHALGGLNKVNAVILNETWLYAETDKYINIPGYDWIGKCRKGKMGGGVGILVSNDQQYRRREDLELKEDNIEHLVLELKVNEGSVILVSLYRPPNTNHESWLKLYKELITKIKEKNDRIVIWLDHNLDLLKFEKHKPTQEFLEWNTDNGLLMSVTKLTRVTHTSVTLIDNIIISQRIYANHLSHILTEDISDHLPCMVSIPELTTCDKGPIRITK